MQMNGVFLEVCGDELLQLILRDTEGEKCLESCQEAECV